MRAESPPAVAYLLKGWPRLSELFIASEIERLEQHGVELRLFVLKPPDEDLRHPIVDRIRATPSYLPATTSLSAIPFSRWLRSNLPAFAPALRRVARRRPLGLARATARAFAQSVRARRRRLAWPRTLYAKELLQAVALADRLLADPGIRHLHAHFAHGTTTVAWLASAITGIPFSFTGHAKDVYEPSLNPAGLLARKLTAARFVVTCTEANRLHLLATAPGARVHRVYHGLNAEFSRLLEGREPRRDLNGHLRVLAIGRLVEKKGFDVLVDACALLTGQGVDLEARIVGPDDAHGEAIRAAIARHGLERSISLVGPLGQDELVGELAAAEAFCLPCRILDSGDRDGIPNVLVEAMACAVPVVTTRVSGIPELVVDGENGLLVEPDSPEQIAGALRSLAADRDRAERIGRAGRAAVLERMDGARLAGELASLFREACR